MTEISTVVRELGAEVASRVTPDNSLGDVGLLFMLGAVGGAALRFVHSRGLDVKGKIGWTAFLALPYIAMLSVGINHQNPEEIGFGAAGLFGLATGYLGMMAISQ